jgi:hypothetical protein
MTVTIPAVWAAAVIACFGTIRIVIALLAMIMVAGIMQDQRHCGAS